MAVSKAERDLLEKLSEPFDPDVVKYRPQGGKQIPYISIDQTIRRFNDITGPGWSFVITDDNLVTLDSGKYLGTLRGELTALGKTAAGVGAATGSDPDMVYKTALAEAIKKAGHQYGVGLELWDEDHREMVAAVQNTTAKIEQAKADGAPELKVLQMEAAKVAIAAGVAAAPAAIAQHFGKTVDDFQKLDVLQALKADGFKKASADA